MSARLALAAAVLGAGALAGASAGPSAASAGAGAAPAGGAVESGTYENLERALFDLASRFPERSRVLRLGESRGGRTLYALEIFERRERDQAVPPAWVVCPEPAERSGPRTALALADALLRGVGPDSRAGASVYVVIDPAPDALPSELTAGGPAGPATEVAASPVATELSHNFPVGWDPWSSGSARVGPYPLCEPESEALARFLVETPNLVGALLLASDPVAPSALESLAVEQADRAVLEALDARPTTVAARGERASRTSLRPGGLAEFAFAGAGLFVVGAGVLPTDTVEPQALRALVELVRDLRRSRPVIAIGNPRLERLAAGLWQVEVEVRNTGSLPTASHVARAWGGGGQLRLVASGPSLVACSVLEPGGGSWRLVPIAGTQLGLGDLDAAEGRSVRLVATGEPGEVLALAVAGPRVAAERTSIELSE